MSMMAVRRIANHMKIDFNRCFNVAWRVALLALPWQTRWIFSIDTIGNNVWEQGTIAIYASWVPMILSIILGAFSLWSSRVERSGTEGQFGIDATSSKTVPPLVPGGLGRDDLLKIAFVATSVVASLFTSSWTATLLWWAHAFVLSAFAWTLWKNAVSRNEFASWFIIALMPHVLLGIWQFLEQKIDGSSWVGMATQRAWTRGVSVVEYGEYRVLRAYGGFPHPNVFGGWLAAGLTLLSSVIAASRSEKERYAWIGSGALLMMALIFTFSRGAWIAALVGVVTAFLWQWKSADKLGREGLKVGGLLMFAIAALTITSQWEAIATRFQGSERLEKWSVEQRVSSVKDGWDAFMHRPLFGWGPGAALKGIEQLGREAPPALGTFTADGSFTIFHAPLEPPHAAPLAAAVEMGAIGVLTILGLIAMLLWHFFKTKQLISAAPVIAIAVILSATDHYLWTLWAGHALVFILLLILVLPRRLDA
jgi:O-antigen ligase